MNLLCAPPLMWRFKGDDGGVAFAMYVLMQKNKYRLFMEVIDEKEEPFLEEPH